MSRNRIERCRELLRIAHARNAPDAPVHVSVALEAVVRRVLLETTDRRGEPDPAEFDPSSFDLAPKPTFESESALAGSRALCHS